MVYEARIDKTNSPKAPYNFGYANTAQIPPVIFGDMYGRFTAINKYEITKRIHKPVDGFFISQLNSIKIGISISI